MVSGTRPVELAAALRVSGPAGSDEVAEKPRPNVAALPQDTKIGRPSLPALLLKHVPRAKLGSIQGGVSMRKLLLGGVAGVALVAAGSADAADLAPRLPAKAPPIVAPVVFSWTGCYAGAQVGWGWGHKTWTNTTTFGLLGDFDIFEPQSASTNQHGAVFGGQVGCNYQFAGAWLIGIDGHLAGADIWGDATPGFRFEEDQTLRARTDWLGSVTGRIGWAGWSGTTLFYVKGGGAWVRETYDIFDGKNDHQSARETRSGWTIGGGVEWAFLPNWSVFAEYDFYGFGSKNLQFIDPDGDISSKNILRIKQEIQTAKVGINYRFNWWGSPPVSARY